MIELIESGSALKPHEVLAAGMPFYEVNNILPYDFTPPAEFTLRENIKTLVRGDFVTGRVGSIGNFAVYREDHPVGISDNVLRFRLLPQQAARTEFLLHFLNSALSAGQIDKFRKGSLQGVINQTTLKTVVVPALGETKENTVVDAMGAARAARRAKLAEADALLAGLDGFLFSALRLNPPPQDSRKVFAATVGGTREASHLNPDYFHPERTLALRAMQAASQRVPCAKLADVVVFIRDQIKTPGPNYLSLAHVQSNTGELVNAEEEVFGACSEFQRGDVLFARLRPYLNKVHRAEIDGCCSPEFHVLRVKDAQSLRPDYLAAILRSSLTLAQTRHMMTGNTHPRLTNEDVVSLIIPIPKEVAVQETIAAEARRRRDEARRLRAEAEVGWQAAKRWFEEQLLGASPP